MIKRLATYLWRHHLALLALFVVLGGTSYAAVNALPKNSVGSKQVINGSLQTLDLSRKARAALKGNRGPRGFTGAQGAKGATGAQGAAGTPGATGPPGTAVAFAHVNPNGTVDAAHSKNITSANVRRAGAGQYCFHGLSFTPVNAVATIGSSGLPLPNILAGTSEVIGGFCNVAGDQAGAFVWNDTSSATIDYPFNIWFE
jgi:hypothetical protein